MTSFILYALFCIFQFIPNGTVYLLVCSLEETDILYDVLILAICFQFGLKQWSNATKRTSNSKTNFQDQIHNNLRAENRDYLKLKD